MAPSNAIALRKSKALTPYHPQAWARILLVHNLIPRYGHILLAMVTGFNAGIPPIHTTYAPPNSPSIATFQAEFMAIIQKEFDKGRYIGPLSLQEVLELIGPFQSFPLSIIPKPGKPGRFRIVQNLSSINSVITSDHFPSTWGTFGVICRLIFDLPKGSEAAVRDVAEAYRTAPVHPSQWPGLVVRISENHFAVDTACCFGLASASGVYGSIADAGVDIFRAAGMSPVSKWVDDHIFFRVPRTALA
jgi:hypothetical protein